MEQTQIPDSVDIDAQPKKKTLSRTLVYLVTIIGVLLLVGFLLGIALIIQLVGSNRANSTSSQDSSSVEPVITSFNDYIDREEIKYSDLKFQPSQDTFLENRNYIYGNFYGNLSLVDATNYKNDIEVYERVFLSKTTAGGFIQRGDFNYSDRTFSTSLIRLGTGGYSYRLITGIKDDSKGYFLSIEIPNLPNDLTSTERAKALAFDLAPEHKKILNLFLDFTKANFDSSLFLEPILDMNAINKFRQTSLDFGGGNFPSTF